MKQIAVMFALVFLITSCPISTVYALGDLEPDLPTFDTPEVPATDPVDPAVKAPDEDLLTIDLSIVGDCTLSTYKGDSNKGSFNWCAATKDPSYFFEKVYSVFSTDDFTIANLETVLTDRKLPEAPKSGSPVFGSAGLLRTHVSSPQAALRRYPWPITTPATMAPRARKIPSPPWKRRIFFMVTNPRSCTWRKTASRLLSFATAFGMRHRPTRLSPGSRKPPKCPITKSYFITAAQRAS